jgi:hypothetical protein
LIGWAPFELYSVILTWLSSDAHKGGVFDGKKNSLCVCAALDIDFRPSIADAGASSSSFFRHLFCYYFLSTPRQIRHTQFWQKKGGWGRLLMLCQKKTIDLPLFVVLLLFDLLSGTDQMACLNGKKCVPIRRCTGLPLAMTEMCNSPPHPPFKIIRQLLG